MQAVCAIDVKLFTPDCTGTLLLIAISLPNVGSSQNWLPSAHQLVRQLLSSASSSSSPLAIVLGGGGGGGVDGKLSRLGFETKCCGCFHQPAGSFLAHRTDTRDTLGELNYNYKLRITTIYIIVHSLIHAI